jgi:hypothetical protein
VEVAAADVLPCADGVRVFVAEPQPKNAPNGDALDPGSLSRPR